jgi:hypothetical protein
VDGDVFGARAFASGWVEAYRNGLLVARRNIGYWWPHYADGGYVGLAFLNAQGAVVDDFGSGTVPGGETMMASGMSSMQVSPSPSGDSEFIVSPTLMNLKANVDPSISQGMPAVVGPKPYVLVPLPDASREKYLTVKPQGDRRDDFIKVIYDVAGSRIQIWRYDLEKGWIQQGRDLSVKFVVGDRFRALVQADGMLEIYRNGKLFAEREVGNSSSTR